MDMRELRENARKQMVGKCRVCPVCNGRACAGEVPGMGGTGTGEAFTENVRALASLKLNLRVIHDSLQPDTTIEMFGQQLKTPIMGAPITGAVINAGEALTEFNMVSALVEGSHLAGSIGWIGDPANPSMYEDGLASIRKAGQGIAIIKPRVSNKEIIELFKLAEKAGAIAVGTDLDGAGLITMALKGQPVGPKTTEQLIELIQSTALPFIIKGIMTVDEAVKCVEVGANAIVISNHGGRVLDHTPGVADVLTEISRAVKGKITILADGGVRSGADVLKLLALGADGVLVGRPLIMGAYGGNTEGVKMIIDKYTSELKAAMILTGCKSVKEIPPEVLWRK
ncbi:FMN-dependent dehydrogenase, includes L-lactate dehydrogenase and type II isopentenyl diphosphate isomerase [Pelosinus propionicus DSM 13327]|uniref:L-lactate oxidase n=2 Tax=Pelosinus TaxID=365348 RepID=A0A1I4L1P6_9FIRM|nr:FMN-dependent dehydrogenase, includes L-lactate dehydrogenase and type II isopentenyl diphosphate isomerase [Pelosinus propionicus DSM 13327]